MKMTEMDFVSVRYGVPRWNPAWAVPEVPVPDNPLHDQAIEYLRKLLEFWAKGVAGEHRVFRNLGIRWIEHEPRSGFDPDLCLLPNAPREEDEKLTTLQLWRHPTPRLAIEVVSPNHPYKDYVDAPERAAAAGIPELWVYDPEMKGLEVHGGPHLLQVFRTTDAGYTRLHGGPGPGYSPELEAYLHPTETEVASRARLRISHDPEGNNRWLTEEEYQKQQRLAAEVRERAAKQAQLAAEERVQAAEARVRELEAELKKRG